MLPKKLEKYLLASGFKYEPCRHKKVYTAFDVAATTRLKMNQIAKNLIVKFNKPFVSGQKPYAMVIVDAGEKIDLKKLAVVVSQWAQKLNRESRLRQPVKGKKIIYDLYNKVSSVSLPKEKDLKEKLKINPGNASAFGSLYKLPVFMEKKMLRHQWQLFSTGLFDLSLKINPRQFAQKEKALLGNFASLREKKRKKNENKKV